MVSDISISYFSKNTKDEVVTAFNEKGLEIYGKHELDYKDSKKQHRKELVKRKFIVIVICNDYLKSPDCLAELIEIYQKCPSEKSFRKRIFPIILTDIPIDDVHYHLQHLKKVEQRLKDVEASVRELDKLSNLNGIYDFLDACTDWRKELSAILNIIADMKMPDFEDLRQKKYDVLINAISKPHQKPKKIRKEKETLIDSGLIKLSPEGKEVYSGRTHYKDHVFSKFIFLNRDTPISKIKNFYRDNVGVMNTKTPIYQVKFATREKADWLFDRLYYEILKTNQLCEYYDKITIPPSLSFQDFKDDIGNKYSKILHQKKIKTGEDILNQLQPNFFHLLPFVIDAKQDDKQLNNFIDEFYDFWKNKPTHTNYLVLLAVNIRNDSPKTIFKWFKKEKPLRKPDIEDLNPINQGDIDSFFSNKLNQPHLRYLIDKKEMPISELWNPMSVRICKALMQK